MIIIKSQNEIDMMRKAGEIVALAFVAIGESIADGISTLDLDNIAREVITKAGAIPSFKNYNGFPKNICVSVNDTVIHGIPSKKELLKNGDIVSVDIGAYYNGFHGDSAKTFPVGEISEQAAKLIAVTRESFYKGIENAIIGNRLGDISRNIEECVESNGFSIVEDYVGHGVGRALHEDPAVPNFVTRGRGIRLQKGLTIAIEPMVNQGRYEVKSLDDGWTVKTVDGSLSAHYEHSIAITDNEPLILTKL